MIDLLTITREVKNIALEAGSFIRTERSAFDKNKGKIPINTMRYL